MTSLTVSESCCCVSPPCTAVQCGDGPATTLCLHQGLYVVGCCWFSRTRDLTSLQRMHTYIPYVCSLLLSRSCASLLLKRSTAWLATALDILGLAQRGGGRAVGLWGGRGCGALGCSGCSFSAHSLTKQQLAITRALTSEGALCVFDILHWVHPWQRLPLCEGLYPYMTGP